MAEQTKLPFAGEAPPSRKPGPVPREKGPLSCEIVIKKVSYPSGGGKVCSEKVKTVEELTRAHLSRYYTLVYQHVQGCRECRPDPVLESYLGHRLEKRKFGGRTSAGLCDLAAKLGRLGARRELVNRFFILCGQPRKLLQREELSPGEFLEGALLVWRDMATRGPMAHSSLEVALTSFEPLGRKRALLRIGLLIDDEAPVPGSAEELRDLLAVSEVMLS